MTTIVDIRRQKVKNLQYSPFRTLSQLPKALVIFVYHLVGNSISAVRSVGSQLNSVSLKSEITIHAAVLLALGRNREQEDS